MHHYAQWILNYLNRPVYDDTAGAVSKVTDEDVNLLAEASELREKLPGMWIVWYVDRKSSRCSSWAEELSVSLVGLQSKREIQSDYFYEPISSCKSASTHDTHLSVLPYPAS